METSKDEKRSRMSGISTVFVDDAPIQQKGVLLSGIYSVVIRRLRPEFKFPAKINMVFFSQILAV